jgi:hypothetical protein
MCVRTRPVRLDWGAFATPMRGAASPRAAFSGVMGAPEAIRTGRSGVGGEPLHLDPRCDGWDEPLWSTDGVGQAVPSHLRLRRT